MQHDVREFIVIAPAGMGKAIEWAEPLLQSYLAGHFPCYSFRIEPFGPFAVDEDFAVIPVMNRSPSPGEKVASGAILMSRLDPSVIPEIQHVLRTFDPARAGIH